MNLIKKLFLNDQGKISFTKIGGLILGLSGVLVANGIITPQVAETIASIGAILGISGARDAMNKKEGA
jgi:hypothetical protein